MKSRTGINKLTTPEISVGLQHKQSKLDLLDNTLLTSFPLPNIDKESNDNNTYSTKNKINTLVDSITSNNEFVTINKDAKLNIISESKRNASNLDYLRSDKYSPILSSITTLSGQTTFSLNNTNNKVKSMTNSLISRTCKPSSKKTTPPSSLDYESSLYDYRLVLEESENNVRKVNKNIYKIEENNETERDLKENYPTTVNQSTHTDIYIQSLYQNLIDNDFSTQEIQCMICKSPVFEDSEYFNKILDFKGIVCENCIRKNDKIGKTSLYEIDSSKFENKHETLLNYIDDTIYSLDQTSHTIQLQFDRTIENEEVNDSCYYDNDDFYDDDEDTTEYGIYQNINFLRDHNNNFNKLHRKNDGNFERVIRKLKRIERTDLRIRQSIADLRGFNQSQFNGNYQSNGDYPSFWGLIKKTFTNNS